jgi:probable HAF family extracellular repeat protein
MKFRTQMRMTAVCLCTALALQLSAQDSSQPKVKHHKYKLVDLGTFGGPRSNIAAYGNGSPYINGKGNVVAIAMTRVPIHSNSNDLVCFPPDTNILHALRWQKTTNKVTDLGALSPARKNCSSAVATNDAGEITGISENGVIDPLIGVTEIRAVLWKHGKITDLGTLGGNASGAGSINNDGQVVGFALNTIPDPFSFYGLGFQNSTNSTQTRAVLWQKGKMQDLGTLGGPDAFANFINDYGQITGVSYTSSMSVDPFVFVWKNRKMTDLGGFGGTSGNPLALNNKGQVAGLSNLAGDASAHPFFWNGKKLKDLGTFGGSSGSANSLNDAGDVVGVANLTGDQIRHAFLWKHGAKKKIDLGTLGFNSAAFGINSQRQVIGASRVNSTTVHAFLWEQGEIVDLNDLVNPKSDAQLIEPDAISDSGEIAANGLPKGCNDESCEHAYVLVPGGNCDDDCESRIAATRNRVAAVALDVATLKQSTAIPVNRLDQ